MHLCNVEAFSGLQELPLHAALHTPCGHVLSCELHRRSTVCAEHAGPGSRNPDLELPSCSEVLLFLLCVYRAASFLPNRLEGIIIKVGACSCHCFLIAKREACNKTARNRNALTGKWITRALFSSN